MRNTLQLIKIHVTSKDNYPLSLPTISHPFRSKSPSFNKDIFEQVSREANKNKTLILLTTFWLKLNLFSKAKTRRKSIKVHLNYKKKRTKC